MTKKEFLELEQFKALPDDAEIVFNTSKDFKVKEELKSHHIRGIRKLMNEAEVLHDMSTLDELIEPKFRVKPIYKDFLVIDALPLKFMESKLYLKFDL